MKKSYESWMTQFVENLSAYLNFAGWRFNLEAEDGEPKVAASGDTVYAHIDINPPYMMATIHLSSLVEQDFKDGEFERIVALILHEMVHVFYAPFADWAKPHLSITVAPLFTNMLEEQTQKLTMVLLKTLPKSVIPPKPPRPKKNG